MTTYQPAVTGAAAGTPQTRATAPRARRAGGAGRIARQAVTALVALAALAAVALIGVGAARSDTASLRDVADHRAAVAEDLHEALAGLDAQNTDELAPGHAVGDVDEQLGDAVTPRITANQLLARISSLLRELGADPARADRVAALFTALDHYEELSGQSGYVSDLHSDRTAGHPPAVAVNLSAQAGAVMRDDLLPVVDALAGGYEQRADDLRDSARQAQEWTAIGLIAVGTPAAGSLVWWQRDLSRRTGRRLNPALLAATGAVVWVTLAGATGLLSAAGHLQQAGSQGLVPWSRLARAQAAGADAAAAQARWFAQDPGEAASYRADFQTRSGQVGSLILPSPGTPPAELPQYAAMSASFGHFRGDDTTMRRLVAAGDTDRAAVVLTEIGRDRVAFDYWDFSTRLAALETTRRADFEREAADAASDLGSGPLLPAVLLGAAALLVLAGAAPRLAEYR